MARGDHEGGYFRGGGDRQRLGGHGRSSMRIDGDIGYGMSPFGLTDADMRVGGRRHRHPRGFADGWGGMGRRMRRSRRR